MNRKEKLKSLRYLIVYDRQVNFVDSSSKIVFGEASWEPRFWPKNGVKWTSLKKSIVNLKKKDIPGYESPTELYTLLIANAYALYGEDPETFIDKSMSEEILRKRKKFLGIHENPRIVDEIEDDPADFDGDLDEELDENVEMDDSFEDNDPYEPAQVNIPQTEEVSPQLNAGSSRNENPDNELTQ